MSDKKRILIFATTYLPFIGGAEIAIWEIVKRNPQIDFEIITLNLDGRQTSFEEKANLKIYRLRGPKILFPFYAFVFSIKLGSFDAFWSVMASYAGFAGLLYSYIHPKTKFILTLQEGDTHEELRKKFQFFWFIIKRIFKRATIIQAISNYLADFAKSVSSTPVVVIPNGVDVSKFREESEVADFKKEPEDFYLVTTSRLVKKNAVRDVIIALTYLPKNIKFLIIGDGSLRRELEGAVAEKDLSDRVMFLGEIEHYRIIPYLKASDIFIRPSLSEGFGNSFVEAMASGLPVIATPVGGIVDFLRDGETGLFCEVNNPEDIARKVVALVENPDLRDKIVSRASDMVRKDYDWNIIADKMKRSVFGVVLG